jgi:site-specific recombinase XerD
MLEQPSPHIGRPYARSTINDRVRSVCPFYGWVHRRGWIAEPPFQAIDVRILSGRRQSSLAHVDSRSTLTAANVLTVSECEKLPRPLRVDHLKLLFADLDTPYRLMAEWAVATGLRRKELCGLTVAQVPATSAVSVDAPQASQARCAALLLAAALRDPLGFFPLKNGRCRHAMARLTKGSGSGANNPGTKLPHASPLPKRA